MEPRDDRKYTREHEWARLSNGEVVVGITSFAVQQLGDVTLVNIDVAVGDRVEAGKPFGTVESVKTLSDLFAPVSGQVSRINHQLVEHPELLNQDPWEAGWMIAIAASAPESELAQLLDALGYREYLSQEQ